MASNTNDNERIRDGENDNEIVKESPGKYYDQNIEMIKLSVISWSTILNMKTYFY